LGLTASFYIISHPTIQHRIVCITDNIIKYTTYKKMDLL